MFYQRRQDVRSVVEINLAVDGPLVFQDMDLGGGESMTFQPNMCVIDGETGLGGYHHDLMARIDKTSNGVDRAGEWVEMPENRVSIDI